MEDQDYEELRKLAGKLHLPMLEAFLEIEVRDKDGKVIQRLKQRSHSWVRNAYNLMFCQLGAVNADDAIFGAGYLNAKDLAGTVRYGDFVYFLAFRYSYSNEAPGFGYRGAAGVDTHGILVGSGTDAESFEDYVLQTLISDGTGAGQISYVEGEAPSLTYTAGTKTWKVEHARYFNNNSGDTISVNELLLVAECAIQAGEYKLAMARDKLASAVNVPDTGQLKVTYTIQLVYPS